MLNQTILQQHYELFIAGNRESFVQEPQEFYVEFISSYFRVLAEETVFNETVEFSFTALIQEFIMFSSTHYESDVNTLIHETVKQYYAYLEKLQSL